VGRLDGKVAVVTAASSPIGQVTAMALAREGARVVAADTDGPKADAVARALAASGATAVGRAADPSHPDDVEALFLATVEAYGALHILYNNPPELAARPGASPALSDHGRSDDGADTTVVDLDLDAWETILRLHLRATMLGCRYAVPHMVKAGGGSIINGSSTQGLAGDITGTGFGTSAAAINTLTMFVATQFGKQNVRCNAVATGLIRTAGAAATEAEAIAQQSVLIPRVGEPRDVAQAVLFLASDESAFITGTILRVDGGQMAHLPHYAQMMAGGMTITKR
jgi:NAD(P)-dependent dehydrogenase (short-subunit alcohol dehydrogenase family)